MKNLKFILAGMILFMTALNSTAQEREQMTAQERAAKQTERMTTELQLTADQRQKIEEINLGVVMKNDAVRNDPNMSDELKRESIKQNNLARKELFRTILTTEQFTKLEEMERTRSVNKKELKKMEKPAAKPTVNE
jgi:hypothetical protein